MSAVSQQISKSADVCEMSTTYTSRYVRRNEREVSEFLSVFTPSLLRLTSHVCLCLLSHHVTTYEPTFTSLFFLFFFSSHHFFFSSHHSRPHLCLGILSRADPPNAAVVRHMYDHHVEGTRTTCLCGERQREKEKEREKERDREVDIERERER